MAVPELADLPFAAALTRHEGDLDADREYDTVLFERAEFDNPQTLNR